MTAVSRPLRIKRLTLTDFRAFPGPAPSTFDFDDAGKNLLVYGENGSGKSSIFYALREFFSLDPKEALSEYKNVYSKIPVGCCQVEVEFTDDKIPARWRFSTKLLPYGVADASPLEISNAVEVHPGKTGKTNDPRVGYTALRRACLDYRALLDTNYLHGDKNINLFDLAVNYLLKDYPVTVSGGRVSTLGKLWKKVEDSVPWTQNATTIKQVNDACTEFNPAFRTALDALHPYIVKILKELIGAEVSIESFTFSGATYHAAFFRGERRIDNCTLIPEISLHGYKIKKPQHFLNEARLSALGLAIHLAGRLACTPTATHDALKLLVLDDVLMGLDHSNRLPVLDVLQKHFADWQIVLLTFDRVWFEMARMHLPEQNWKYTEIFEGVDAERGIPVPVIRSTSSKAAEHNLNVAREFLKNNHIPAAANYARAAFEMTLKQFCERFSVPVAFKMDQRHLDTGKLLDAVEVWLKNQHAKVCMVGIIERVKLFRKVVLNPYSHSTPPNIARAEVEGAISAVNKLLAVLDPCAAIDDEPLAIARYLINKSSPSAEELHAALGYLRAAFLTSLIKFCEKKHVQFRFTTKLPDARTLWSKVMADSGTLCPAPHAALPAQIEAERCWLIDPVTDTGLAAITQADLSRVAGVVAPSGSATIVLDEI